MTNLMDVEQISSTTFTSPLFWFSPIVCTTDIENPSYYPSCVLVNLCVTLLVPPFVLFLLLVSVTSQIIERGSPSCLVFAQCSDCTVL